jgi:predicted GH43/DUF377 family glycosyl hydrolase
MPNMSPLKRYEGNPIITAAHVPADCWAVFNAGATKFDGRYLLLLRVEMRDRRSDFHVALSDNGYDFTVRPEPINYPLRPVEERYGSHRFDMRITELDGTYYCFHALWMGSLHCAIGLAVTQDFVDFEPMPYCSVPSNRNAVLFPEKIGGRYVRLERPELPGGRGCIWLSESPDLVHWGRSRPLDVPVTGWSTKKLGAGAVPVRTDRGWLEIYHGVGPTCSTDTYFLGALLLELDDPSRIVAAPREFILAPEETYECVGQTPNVVFTSGAITDDDGRLLVYYGGADQVVAVAESTVDALVDFCLSAP